MSSWKAIRSDSWLLTSEWLGNSNADLFSGLVDTILADVHRLELTLGDASLEFTADEVSTFFETLLAYARE